MIRERWIIRSGKLVRVDDEAPEGPAPRLHVISDACEVKSMADGKVYTSKRRYYDSVKAHGFQIVGNEAPTPRKREPDEKAIARVVDGVMRGEIR